MPQYRSQRITWIDQVSPKARDSHDITFHHVMRRSKYPLSQNRNMAKKKAKTSSTEDKSDDRGIDFEESLGEVEGIVSQLESGELGLTASLQKYEQGIRELKQCQTLLDAAEQKISQLSGFDADGNPVTTPQPNTPTATQRNKTAGRGKKPQKSPTADTSLASVDENASSVDDSPGLF